MRASYLDSLRGMAVIWMIIFHSCYDLGMFQVISWDFRNGFWYAFPRVIAFTFLFCVGISLNFTHKNKINWDQLKKRTIKLGGAALIISIVTYFLFPKNWIYFGTIHCICIGSIIGAYFVNHRKAALLIVVIIIFLQYGLGYDIKWVSSLTERTSLDFIPIYPWLWAILAGVLIGPYLSKIAWLNTFKSPEFLNILGRHSLKIYLIHQPLIYGLIWIFVSLRS
jgi:uncharacterized membrane protein